MTLGGKSLLASTLLNSAVVAVMAGVAFYPAPRKTIPDESGDLGAGFALVMDAPPDAAPPADSLEQLELKEIAPPMPPVPDIEIDSAPVPDQTTVAEIVSTTSPSVLPAIAASPLVSTVKKESRARAKTASRRGAIPGAGLGNGASGRAGIAAYTPAEYAQTPRPLYPYAAKKAGISGTVILSVSIDENGHPIAVSKTRGSGNAELDEAAIAAVQKWRFHPAKMNDIAVAARLQVPVRFALN